jgi:hypothetical protein
MSDVPQRPRIRPATSDDWQKDHRDSAGQNPSYGNEAGSSPAEFDNSTYYEYLERHTGEQSPAKARSGNVFAPAGCSPFDDRSQPAHPQQYAGRHHNQPVADARSAGVSAGPGSPTPPPPQFPPSVPAQGGAKPRRWLKVTAVIIAMIMVLALVAFFGIRWLAPSSGTVPVDVGTTRIRSALAQLVRGPRPAVAESSREKLNAYTEEGTERAADLEGQWVTQVSAKNVGLEADGKTWTVEDILNEYEANKVKYPGAILIQSGDWASYQ